MVGSVAIERAEVDGLIFGGGIAGLWTLARLRREGYSALLVECDRLGAGQTIASQGIIHGGVKYALGGHATSSSEAISAMPDLWRACLAGRGEVDLSRARTLSDRCAIWTAGGFGARLMGLAASRAIRARPRYWAISERPAALAEAPAGVDVYGVDEPVLDVASVVRALADAHESALIAAPFPDGVRLLRGEAGIESVRLVVGVGFGVREVEVRAERYIFCAGAGNAEYLSRLGPAIAGFVRMQRRPLHMVLARGDLPELHGHAIGASPTPLATITSARTSDGDMAWWIGGRIAEEGVERGAGAQIEAAREELGRLLPWVRLEGARYATWRVDRAEGAQTGGKRPEGAIVRRVGNAIFCWPTKLALAPVAAGAIVREMLEVPRHAQATLDVPRAGVADPPWEDGSLTWTA